ncbi:DinB family protein [Hypericibacter sp.]|uniref:DinB family protein n=1 Tax=Hypericibacter sp. TaxID=2705401 RepID=UPI003D6D91FB
MADLPYFRRLARYNGWANRRLYFACADFSPAEWAALRAGFFPSLQKTLNHILVGDRLWLARFEQAEPPYRRLDELPHPEFSELKAAREAEDERIVTYTMGLDSERLAGDLIYTNVAGEPQRTPLHWALTHFFNHQTHHRGQAHAMLSSTAVKPPSLDLILFLREELAS